MLLGRTRGRLARFSLERSITFEELAVVGEVSAELDVELLLVELGESGSMNLLSEPSLVDVDEEDEEERDEDLGLLIAVLRGRTVMQVVARGVREVVQVVVMAVIGVVVPLSLILLSLLRTLQQVPLSISSLAKQGVKLSLSNEVVGNLCS